MAAEVPSKTVEAEGFGETVDAAMKNARENAVRVAFGEVVDSLSEIKNEELLESTISVSSGFILSYKIINPPKYDSANKYYTVKIEAVIATEKIKDHVNRLKKSSSEVNISALMQADDDVEKQEQNVIKFLEWWNMTIAKNLSFHDVSIQFENSGNLVLRYRLELPQQLDQHMLPIAEKVLLANGFSRTDRYGRSSISFGYRNGKELIYSNPDIEKRFHNYDYQWKLSHIITTANGEKIDMRYFYKNQDIRPYLLSTGGASSHYGNGYKYPASAKECKNIKSIQIYAQYGLFYDKYSKPFLLKEFIVNGNDLSSQKESLQNREKAIQDMLINAYRESFKFYVPTAKIIKYNKKKETAAVKISIAMDKRGYVKFARKLIKQLESLSLEGNNRLYIKLPSSQRQFKIPAGAGSTSFHAIYNSKKYSYYLILKFKDEEGEILQEYKCKIPPYQIRWNHIYFIDYYQHELRTISNFEFDIDVKFDIPEDAKLVKSIECSIEERVKQ